MEKETGGFKKLQGGDIYQWTQEPCQITDIGGDETFTVPKKLKLWYGSHESGLYGFLGRVIPEDNLAGSSQGVEAEPQGAAHDGRPLIGGHAQQEPLDVLHPGKRREVLRPLGGQSPPEGGGDIGLAGPRRDAVACHLPKNPH